MRRVRYLNNTGDVVLLKQRTNQLIIQNQDYVILERTWHRSTRLDFELDIHVKFNADLMNGIQIRAKLLKGGRLSSMSIVSASLFRVDEASWAETLVASPTLIEDLGFFVGTVDQATLLTNELSGMEVYALEIVALRHRRTFKKKVYFNHLGCFDSINILRQITDELRTIKGDF